jgi:hypothetical protein
MSWTQVLEEDLHLLGHRNWILVADKAFPEQSSAGMKYLYVEQDLLPTLEYVLNAIDESSSLFRVLVIKTNCVLPYTSVFLQLDCSYWGPENEKVLREKM